MFPLSQSWSVHITKKFLLYSIFCQGCSFLRYACDLLLYFPLSLKYHLDKSASWLPQWRILALVHFFLSSYHSFDILCIYLLIASYLPLTGKLYETGDFKIHLFFDFCWVWNPEGCMLTNEIDIDLAQQYSDILYAFIFL